MKIIQLAETYTLGELLAKHEVEYPTQKVYLEAYLLKPLLSAEYVTNAMILDQVSQFIEL